jgi:hypothetical protein
MVLGSQRLANAIEAHNPVIEMNGVNVTQVSEARNLGLLVDRNLRCENHVAETVRFRMYRLKVLYNVRDF